MFKDLIITLASCVRAYYCLQVVGSLSLTHCLQSVERSSFEKKCTMWEECISLLSDLCWYLSRVEEGDSSQFMSCDRDKPWTPLAKGNRHPTHTHESWQNYDRTTAFVDGRQTYLNINLSGRQCLSVLGTTYQTRISEEVGLWNPQVNVFVVAHFHWAPSISQIEIQQGSLLQSIQ